MHGKGRVMSVWGNGLWETGDSRFWPRKISLCPHRDPNLGTAITLANALAKDVGMTYHILLDCFMKGRMFACKFCSKFPPPPSSSIYRIALYCRIYSVLFYGEWEENIRSLTVFFGLFCQPRCVYNLLYCGELLFALQTTLEDKCYLLMGKDLSL